MSKDNEAFSRRRRRTNPSQQPQGRFDNDKSQPNSLASFRSPSRRKLSSKRANYCHRFWFWCLETKKTARDKLSKLTKTQIKLLVLAKFVWFCLKLLLLHWIFSKWFPRKFLGRSETDEVLNEMSLIIPMFDIPDHSIGGWQHRYSKRFFNPHPLSKKEDRNKIIPDFGGLSIFRSKEAKEEAKKQQQQQQQQQQLDHPIDGEPHEGADKNDRLAPPRQIHPDDARLAYLHWNNYTDYNYIKIKEGQEWPEDIEDRKEECRYPSWARKAHPTCNSFHEIDMMERKDKHYVSHGDFRDVWLLDHVPLTGDPNNDELFQTALKVSRYYTDFDRRIFWGVLQDAGVMGGLSMSPRIVDIFGHCGGSVWVEPMPTDIVEVVIYDKGEGLIKQKDLNDEKEVKPQNKVPVEEKLNMALTMAESLADLHGFRDGVIVHDDAQLAQWLRTPDGRVKFGDFNRIVILPYNSKDGEYCTYKYNSRPWRYRSPEEYESYWHDKDETGWMNEQIDTYTYGNTIYGLLTGLWPFYDVNDDEVVAQHVMNGTRSFVDPRYKSRSFIESKLVEVMEQCWRHDPNERITIFEAVKQLRAIKKEYDEKHKKKQVSKRTKA